MRNILARGGSSTAPLWGVSWGPPHGGPSLNSVRNTCLGNSEERSRNVLSVGYAFFIDVGFLRAEGRKIIDDPSSQIRLNAREITKWCRSIANRDQIKGRFIRAYWYDAAFHPAHKLSEGQRKALFAIGQIPGIQLRLGHISETNPKNEPLIREALRKTASGLGIPSNKLIDEFERHWTFRALQVLRGSEGG